MPPAAAADPPPVDTRPAIPSEADQQRASQVVRDVFEAEFRQASTPSEQDALARQMIGVALETDDTIQRFVLLRTARDIAAAAGEITTAVQAIQQLDRQYRVDAFRMKSNAALTADRAGVPRPQRQKIAQVLLELAAEAVSQDHFDVADKLLEAALGAARKARDTELTRRIVSGTKEAAALREQYEAARDALSAVEGATAEAAAHLAAGRYLCLFKNDWARGLPHLAQGSDPTLKRLAAAELAEPAESAAQLALADGWWLQAQQEAGAARGTLLARAVRWYRQALPGVKGLERIRVEQRLGEPPVEPGVLALVRPSDTAQPEPATSIPPAEGEQANTPPPGTRPPTREPDAEWPAPPAGQLPPAPRPGAQPPPAQPPPAEPSGDAPQGGPLVVLYRCDDRNPGDNQIRLQLKVVNSGSTAVPLAALTLRYWYTSDAPKPQQFWCDYAKVGSREVLSSFHTLPRPVAGADGYLEIAFAATAPALAPGSDTGDIQVRIAKEDWSNYDGANDYSFDAQKTDFTAWPHVTLYHRGTLVWGREPAAR